MKTFKLNAHEEEALKRYSISINRELVRLGYVPMPESKILHEILQQCVVFGEIEVTRDGKIRVLANELIESKK